ncbi:MAG: TonB-dependent receptor, partial [Nitrococcus sp.]|nr:TonB-dependent receptor [Nitrococcus sp.]
MIAKDSQSYRPSIDVFDPDSRQPLNPPTGFSGVRDIRQQNIGVYFQDQARIYDNWIVTLGAHYDWVDSKTEDKLAGTTSENDDKAFTWRAGLLYHFDNGIAPYFSYATSFEPVTGTNLFGERFEPTTGQQYEIGAKFQPPGSDALFSVAVFDLRQQNVRTTDPENAQNQIQTGEVRSRGIELEANAGFDFGLDLTAAVTLLDVDITESTEGVEGNTPTRVIEESVSVYGDYTLQRGPLSGSNSNFDPQPTGAAGQML